MTLYAHEDTTNFEKLGHRYDMDMTNIICIYCVYTYS